MLVTIIPQKTQAIHRPAHPDTAATPSWRGTAERAGCQGACSAQIAIASRIAMTTTASLPPIETKRWILGVNRRPA